MDIAYHMMEGDSFTNITHPQLRVEKAADALAVMFLVECGILPSTTTDGPPPLELGCHLGHGNVLVFLDNCANTTSLVLQLESWVRISYHLIIDLAGITG